MGRIGNHVDRPARTKLLLEAAALRDRLTRLVERSDEKCPSSPRRVDRGSGPSVGS